MLPPLPFPFTVPYGKYEKLVNATSEEWAKWEFETDAYNKEVALKNEKLRMQHRNLITDAMLLYGEKHNVVLYLKKQPLPLVNVRNLSDIKSAVQKLIIAKKIQEKETEIKDEQMTLLAEAIAYLIARNKKLGEDFNAKNAIETANNIAYHEAIESKIKEGGPFDFSDKTCDDCAGWDGHSRRCDCANRRVGWVEGPGHSFKNPQIYAEAW